MQTPYVANSDAKPDERPASTFSTIRPWLTWLGAGVALGWLLAIIWWAVLSPDARAETLDELVIPPGTAEAIRTGGATFVPSQVALRPGSRLVIVNQDTEEHAVGNAVIPPGATAELSVPDEGEGFYCSIHPSGFLGVDLKERPSFFTTIVPALLVGLPIGLITAAASWVGRKIDFDDHGDETPGAA